MSSNLLDLELNSICISENRMKNCPKARIEQSPDEHLADVGDPQQKREEDAERDKAPAVLAPLGGNEELVATAKAEERAASDEDQNATDIPEGHDGQHAQRHESVVAVVGLHVLPDPF